MKFEERLGLPLAAAITVGLAAVLQSPCLWASSGTEGASFLNIPVGAGPASLGSAYTALATDAYAPVWNPAGLGFLRDDSIAGQHVSYLESINYEYLSFVHPFGESRRNGLGFSAQYLTSGDITATGDAGPTPIGTFSSHFGSYNLAYGRALTDRLSLGVTGKWINEKIDNVSANAYAADLGGLYRLSENIQLAASATNLGSKLTFLSHGDSLPMAIHLGGAYQPDPRWLVSTEGVYQKTGLASFHVGGQWKPMEATSLRVGYKTDTLKGLSPLAGFTTGIGLHLWGQEFAYAWAPYGDLGSAQYFSLLIHFGAQSEHHRNLVKLEPTVKHRLDKTAQSADNGEEEETQQLMQLLQEGEVHTARVGKKMAGDENDPNK